MTSIPVDDALCCLISAVAASAADADAPEYQHQYPTANMTLPYCPHDSVIAKSLGRSTTPPPGTGMLPAEHPQTTGLVQYHRFHVASARPAPGSPDGTACLAELYGDCSSPADVSTLAGHEKFTIAESERLERELMQRWCDCLMAKAAADGHLYSRAWPRWIETSTKSTDGRFTVVAFIVAAQLL